MSLFEIYALISMPLLSWEIHSKQINPFRPEFTIVILIHYNPRIAVAILDLWMKMIWCGLKIKKKYHVLVNQFQGIFCSKSLGCREIKYIFRDVKWCFNASWGLKGLSFSGGGRWMSWESPRLSLAGLPRHIDPPGQRGSALIRVTLTGSVHSWREPSS